MEHLPGVVRTIFEKWVGVQSCGSVGDWCLQKDVGPNGRYQGQH